MAKKAQLRRVNPRKVHTCKQATALILDYLTGELDPKTARLFEEHLMVCPDCVSFLNSYKETIKFTRSLSYEDIPSDMKKRIRRFLRDNIG
ncbi:MAG: anti-sigma factor family protein [Thermodesulfobacteriota bacterium]